MHGLSSHQREVSARAAFGHANHIGRSEILVRQQGCLNGTPGCLSCGSIRRCPQVSVQASNFHSCWSAHSGHLSMSSIAPWPRAVTTKPAHFTVLRFRRLVPDGSTASELGRRLGVSKQAAAKTVASLENRLRPPRAGPRRRACDSLAADRTRRGNAGPERRVLRDIPRSPRTDSRTPATR
jgi:hypothetical protein